MDVLKAPDLEYFEKNKPKTGVDRVVIGAINEEKSMKILFESYDENKNFFLVMPMEDYKCFEPLFFDILKRAGFSFSCSLKTVQEEFERTKKLVELIKLKKKER